MRLGIVFETLNPTMEAMLRVLAARGREVVRLPAAKRPFARDCDAYYLKSSSSRALGGAAALARGGARFVNSLGGSTLLADKLRTTWALGAAGVRVPHTRAWDAGPPPVKGADGPWIVKPRHGSKGRGVRLAASDAELSAARAESREPLLVQRYVPGAGHDRKLYGIGGRLFGVERPLGARAHADKIGRAFAVDGALAALAAAVARTFALRAFGVDLVFDEHGPAVIDVNASAGFIGVDEAPELLADVFEGVAAP